jgi:hypothetical protein
LPYSRHIPDKALGLSSTMPQAAQEHLLLAYKHQIDWLLALADEFESGARRLMGKVAGQEIDLTPNVAEECRHRAGNMQAVLQAYERLHAKGT